LDSLFNALTLLDLSAVVKKARHEGKDIILTGDFNELVGDDLTKMAKVLEAGQLTDVHGHQHGEVDIKTYTRGHKRLDYVYMPITDRPTIEQLILRRNIRHFRQAEKLR
jgi:endonuclease/exonuclease/phosphatase family metal-dependent hydrolase